jgi:2-oxoisovalerate ferredoxin oxidoreductase delta subunit
MSDKKPYPVIQEIECKACLRCVVACPVKVIEPGAKLNARGYAYVVYKGDGCTGCGNCFYTCPEPNAIEVHIPGK